MFSLARSTRVNGGRGMIQHYVGLTTLSDRVRPEELAAIAAALQTQVMRDFEPEWGVAVLVAAVPFDAIPAGYIPLIVHDTLEADGSNGFHRTRSDDTPYILVPYGPSWSLAASHELLRMLVNPTGSARRPGPSCLPGQGTVEYLIDVCAPCQDVSAAYAIDGVVVSDFCTRAFFGGTGQRYSFSAAVPSHLTPAANGVVTWLADDALMYQARADGHGRIRVHGGFSPANRARMLLRELVDMLLPDRLTRLSNAPLTRHLVQAAQDDRRVRLANVTRFQEDIAWRFGHASADPAGTMPRRPARRQKVYADDGARSGQNPTSDEVAITARTAS